MFGFGKMNAAKKAVRKTDEARVMISNLTIEDPDFEDKSSLIDSCYKNALEMVHPSDYSTKQYISDLYTSFLEYRVEMTENILRQRKKEPKIDWRTSVYPHRLNSYLTGLNHENRHVQLKRYINQEAEYEEKYQGLKGKSLIEELEYDNVWEYEQFSVDVELVHEGDNEYDSNAIAVLVSIAFEDVKVGYIPKEDNEMLLNIINNHDWTASGIIKGGKYKELNWFDSVETNEVNYGMDIIIYYK